MTRRLSPKDRIRKRKAELGLTTSQIARRGDLPRPTVDAYVCGKASPSYRNLIALSVALNVPRITSPDLQMIPSHVSR